MSAHPLPVRPAKRSGLPPTTKSEKLSQATGARDLMTEGTEGTVASRTGSGGRKGHRVKTKKVQTKQARQSATVHRHGPDRYECIRVTNARRRQQRGLGHRTASGISLPLRRRPAAVLNVNCSPENLPDDGEARPGAQAGCAGVGLQLFAWKIRQQRINHNAKQDAVLCTLTAGTLGPPVV